MEAAVRKAVFPVAGLGTRMLPMTRAVPKEMLPVVDRPLIQYAVEEAVAAGIEELVFVTDRPRPLLESHFGPVPALAGKVETGAGGERLDAARALLPEGVRLAFARQEAPLGLGHAVWCAREAVADEPFAVLLPDDLMAPGCLGELIAAFRGRGAGAVLAVEEVAPEDTARYGVVDTASDRSEVARVASIVEKPAPEEAPSNLAVVGRYVFDPSILDLLADLPPGAGGEIQLTDAIAALAAAGAPVYAHRLPGVRHDCGTRAGWLRATAALALAHDDGGGLRRDLAALLA